MMSGLIARSASYPSPQLSSTPGEKPSATTSDIATSRRAISRPFGCLTFSEIPRLPGFLLLNWPPMSGSVTPGSGPVAFSRAAREPVRIHRVLVRLPQRRPEHAGLLGLAPWHVLVGERAHEALHGLHGVVTLRRARPGARNEASARWQRGFLWVEAGVHAVALEQLDELLGLARARAEVRHDPAAVLGVHDGWMRRDALARVTAGLPQHERSSHHPRHEVDLGGFRHRLVDRARQGLPLAGAPAIEQRGDDGHRELLAGNVEGVPHLRRDRGQIVGAARRRIVAAIHHDAAERQVHQVRALERGPRTVVAERRRPRGDQRGKLAQERGHAEPERIELALRRRLQQHVGGGDQRAELILALRLTQVEHDGTLPAVVLPEEQRALRILSVLVKGTDAARGAAAGRLYLDDVGAQPGQSQAAVFRLLVGQLDDADPCEGTSAALLLGLHG